MTHPRTPTTIRQSITPEQRARWNFERDDLIDDDIWYSSFWLSEQLALINCPPDIGDKICFSTGQHQTHESTPEGIWSQAIIALENYTTHGTWDEPGETLALKLLHKNFGTPVDVTKLLDWLMHRPTGRNALVVTLADMQATGKMPEKPKTPWE